MTTEKQEIIQYIDTVSNGLATVATISPGLILYSLFIKNHPKNYSDFPELIDSTDPFIRGQAINTAYLTVPSLYSGILLSNYSDLIDTTVLAKCVTIKQLRLLLLPNDNTLSFVQDKYSYKTLRDVLHIDSIMVFYSKDMYLGSITLFSSNSVTIVPIQHPSIEEYEKIQYIDRTTILETESTIINQYVVSNVPVRHL